MSGSYVHSCADTLPSEEMITFAILKDYTNWPELFVNGKYKVLGSSSGFNLVLLTLKRISCAAKEKKSVVV